MNRTVSLKIYTSVTTSRNILRCQRARSCTCIYIGSLSCCEASIRYLGSKNTSSCDVLALSGVSTHIYLSLSPVLVSTLANTPLAFPLHKDTRRTRAMMHLQIITDRLSDELILGTYICPSDTSRPLCAFFSFV